MKLRFSIWAVFAAAVISLFSLLAYTNETMVLATRSSDLLIDDVYDSGESLHPSGNDRNSESGNSGTQGKSTSNPDGNGADKRRASNDGSAGGTQGHGDYDDNNGCGNDNDFADDNNGNCGGKNKTSPKPSHSPRPSSTPGPIGGIVNENNNENNNNNSNENTVNITIENNQTQTQTVNTNVPQILPATGVSTLGLATMFGSAPLGVILSRFGRGRVSKNKEDLANIASMIAAERLAKKISL